MSFNLVNSNIDACPFILQKADILSLSGISVTLEIVVDRTVNNVDIQVQFIDFQDKILKDFFTVDRMTGSSKIVSFDLPDYYESICKIKTRLYQNCEEDSDNCCEDDCEDCITKCSVINWDLDSCIEINPSIVYIADQTKSPTTLPEVIDSIFVSKTLNLSITNKDCGTTSPPESDSTDIDESDIIDCCDWDGLGFIQFDDACGGLIMPIIFRKISKNKWIAQGELSCGDSINISLICNPDAPVYPCDLKWSATIDIPCVKNLSFTIDDNSCGCNIAPIYITNGDTEDCLCCPPPPPTTTLPPTTAPPTAPPTPPPPPPDSGSDTGPELQSRFKYHFDADKKEWIIMSESSNSANFRGNSNWNGSLFGNVTSVGTSGKESYYGTYDQTGNVYEIIDRVENDTRNYGVWRGGSFRSPYVDFISFQTISAKFRDSGNHLFTEADYGFRISSINNEYEYDNFIEVSDIGNNADIDEIYGTYGSVDYAYYINRYPVTQCDYVEFLNSVAKNDSNSLYNEKMSESPFGGIIRSGSIGNYNYNIKEGYENKPVGWITWPIAARYCNWLHNNKKSGEQDSTTTENGSYNLIGLDTTQVNPVDGTPLPFVTPLKNVEAKYYLPTENEWYKAAYYKGGSLDAGYWLYSTQNNELPLEVFALENKENLGDATLNGIDPVSQTLFECDLVPIEENDSDSFDCSDSGYSDPNCLGTDGDYVFETSHGDSSDVSGNDDNNYIIWNLISGPPDICEGSIIWDGEMFTLTLHSKKLGAILEYKFYTPVRWREIYNDWVFNEMTPFNKETLGEKPITISGPYAEKLGYLESLRYFESNCEDYDNENTCGCNYEPCLDMVLIQENSCRPPLTCPKEGPCPIELDINDMPQYDDCLCDKCYCDGGGRPIDIDVKCGSPIIIRPTESDFDPDTKTYTLWMQGYGEGAVPVINNVLYDTSLLPTDGSVIVKVHKTDNTQDMRNWTCQYLRFVRIVDRSKLSTNLNEAVESVWPYNDLYWDYKCIDYPILHPDDVPINLVPC
jgi:formylglycine-generating enzyme required for sulfatase activity